MVMHWICSLLRWISCNVLLDAFRRLGPNAMRHWSYDAQRQSRLCERRLVSAALFAAPPGDPATSCPPGTACSISVAGDCV